MKKPKTKSFFDRLIADSRTGKLQQAMGDAIRESCKQNEALGLKPSKAEIDITNSRKRTY
ncbi:hypothetical protein KIK84_16290 [Curvibacter sp. CHRR-16]|uniref:hypothetical protein n=1 Tax=Curvibacter sp. CHRR-16 TaxID=2835872 RepID=UPI001BD93F3E|nr:hypothetical protein [Curvibacter sp. CHRR-16]MBT0571875.1 hypothetical protein [Curvibacter sp. CHRR-16]